MKSKTSLKSQMLSRAVELLIFLPITLSTAYQLTLILCNCMLWYVNPNIFYKFKAEENDLKYIFNTGT